MAEETEEKAKGGGSTKPDLATLIGLLLGATQVDPKDVIWEHWIVEEAVERDQKRLDRWDQEQRREQNEVAPESRPIRIEKPCETAGLCGD